jgi:hypothetical protein
MALRNIELEILEFNYWEHFKIAKDLSMILPLGHEKRVRLDDEMEKLITRINKIKNEIK